MARGFHFQLIRGAVHTRALLMVCQDRVLFLDITSTAALLYITTSIEHFTSQQRVFTVTGPNILELYLILSLRSVRGFHEKPYVTS